jgi:hypothetical protein
MVFMMKYTGAIFSLLFLVLSINSCNDNITIDTGKDAEDWNTVRSTWVDAATYDDASEVAQNAMNKYLARKNTGIAYTIDHFQIVLESVVVNADGSQSWTYSITKLGNGPTMKDLSHFTMLFSSCDNSHFIDYHGGGWGPDPSASSCTGGADGIKWDWGVSAGDTAYYQFTTDQAYDMGFATGLVKYSTNCSTGLIPGPDCTTVINPDPDPDPDPCGWIDRLNLGVSIQYFNYRGFNSMGFPVYYVGDTMNSTTTICNLTPDPATNLTVTIIEEFYQTGTLCPGASTSVWNGVTIAANDCLDFNKAYSLTVAGNFQTHVIVERDADQDCPTAALIFDSPTVGFWDP